MKQKSKTGRLNKESAKKTGEKNGVEGNRETQVLGQKEPSCRYLLGVNQLGLWRPKRP